MKLIKFVLFCFVTLMTGFPPTSSRATEKFDIEAKFHIGLKATANGDFDNAISTFQSILALDPGLTRVRLELARAYFLTEQWSRSRSEFFKVLSGNIPEPARQRVLGFIRAIDARRGFEWDLEIGIKRLGSTRNYDTDDIELDLGGVTFTAMLNRTNATTHGLGFSSSALWQRGIDAMSDDTRAVIGFFEFFTFGDLADVAAFRDTSFGVRGGARFVFPNTTASVSPVISTRYISDEHFEDRIGLETFFERRNLNAYSIFGSLAGYKVNNKFDNNFSGHEISARLGVRRSIGGNRTVGLAIYGENKSTDRSINTYTTVGVEAFGSFDMGAGLVAEPRIYFAQKSFGSPNPLLKGDPGEVQYGGNIRVEKRDLIFGNGFVPFAEAEYNRSKSGIDAFSYDETLVYFGITKAF